jgi:endonuclease YncB( thermonuclease family)
MQLAVGESHKTRGEKMGDVWTVPAQVTKVVDGDTVHLKMDLGWHITYDARIRLIGCNAPELSTDEGQVAKRWVMATLAGYGALSDGTGIEITFISHELDKYGRPLGQVIITTPRGERFDLGSALIAAGHAVPM